MADAEIIPIGTRGRPGRGTGSAKPSASARSLAGTGARSRAATSGAAKARSAGAQQEDGTTTSPVVEAVPVAKARSAKPAATRTGSTESGAAKTGSAKTGSAKRGSAKTGSAKTGSAKTGSTKPAKKTTSRPGTSTAGTPRAVKPPAAESPGTRPAATSAAESAETPAAETPAAETPAAETPAAETPAAETSGESTREHAGRTVGPDEPGDRRTSSTFTEDRGGDGIPVTDWIEAFSIASQELFGEDWEPRLAEFLAFLRKRLSGDYAVDEYGFDPELTERFFYAAIRPIAEKWFRVEVRGAENIPTEGGALVVSNHSGTIPVDGLVTGVSIFDHTGRHLRPLGADLVFRLPVIGELARKGGATLACNEDAERMLRGGELVGVWPEGFKGIGKPYSDRYKLQRFGRGGFVSAAVRTGVPIIPCSVVGAEEIYPLVGNLPSLARLLGVPYIPITPFFPALGLLGLIPLPSKWLIEFGEPIRTDSYDHGAADDPMLVFNVTDQVRETIQQTLYSLLMQRRSVFH